MNHFHRFLCMLLLIFILASTLVACKQPENPQEDTKSQTEEKEETTKKTSAQSQAKNPLADIGIIRLEKNSKGTITCRITPKRSWSAHLQGSHTSYSFQNVTRFIYKIEQNTQYGETTSNNLGPGDGTQTEIGNNKTLTVLILVFQKGYKLTDNEKQWIEELGIGYMFER